MEHRRRFLASLLALALLVSVFPVTALAEPAAYPEELVVGNPTEMRGDFFTEMFGNNTADIDVRSLIHGYNLVNWDQDQGVYVFDPSVVTAVSTREDRDSNRTYQLTLADDLRYSDGTPITAWDYAFSLLLMMSPEMEKIGAKIYRDEHIAGYRAYITGEASALTGVRVVSEHELSITLDHAFLPFFFETGLFLCVPYPMHVIAPGCRVYDDGAGVYIGNEDKNEPEPVFTAELLQKTVLDPETGYNSHPSVVSGPYRLVSFDGVTARFELNPYHKGTWASGAGAGKSNGSLVKPAIEKIAFTSVKSEDVPQLLADGTIHLANKMVYGPVIQELLQGSGETGVVSRRYPRIGLTFLTFSYDWPTVHEKEVRQAIAWCLDRDALTEAYCQGFGESVNGYYGIGKWEYLLADHQIDPPVRQFKTGESLPADYGTFENLYAASDEEYEQVMKAWQAVNLDQLTPYAVDTAKANSLLDQAGWTLNRDGEAYRPGTDDVRCKQIDGELVALELTMMYPEGNRIADTMQENFIDHLKEAGILLALVPAPMDQLLTSYYRETERTTDMIYLGTNFHAVVDPSITYSADTALAHASWNNTFSDDDTLYRLAVAMRKTRPGDLYGYMTAWVAFQKRYNEVLPAIPLYSNFYYDFHVPYLRNYNIESHVTWGQAIVFASFGAPEEESAPDGGIG